MIKGPLSQLGAADSSTQETHPSQLAKELQSHRRRIHPIICGTFESRLKATSLRIIDSIRKAKVQYKNQIEYIANLKL